MPPSSAYPTQKIGAYPPAQQTGAYPNNPSQKFSVCLTPEDSTLQTESPPSYATATNLGPNAPYPLSPINPPPSGPAAPYPPVLSHSLGPAPPQAPQGYTAATVPYPDTSGEVRQLHP